MAKTKAMRDRSVIRSRVLHMKARIKRLESLGTYPEGYIDRVRKRLSKNEQLLHAMNKA